MSLKTFGNSLLLISLCVVWVSSCNQLAQLKATNAALIKAYQTMNEELN